MRVVTPSSRSHAAFALATFLFWSSMYLYVPILAVHAENLGASAGLVGAVVGSYGLTQMLLRFPVGVASDRLGARKPFILVGIAAAGLGALGMGMTSDPAWLVLGRGMSGVGAAGWVAFTVLYAAYLEPGEVTRAMGRMAFIGGTAQMVSTYSGGLIAQNLGWSAPFYGAAALAAAGLLIASTLKEKALPARRDQPPRGLLRIGTVPLLVAVSTVTMLATWTQWATANSFSLVYAAHLGADRAELGFQSTLVQAAYTMAVLLSPYLVDRIGMRRVGVLGLTIQSLGALAVPFTDSLSVVALTQLMSGGGRGLTYPAMMGLSVRAVPDADRASAMGVFQAVYALGIFGGPATTGLLADHFGLESVFLVAAGATMVGIFVVMRHVPWK